jgi:hypothetical protein
MLCGQLKTCIRPVSGCGKKPNYKLIVSLTLGWSGFDGQSRLLSQHPTDQIIFEAEKDCAYRALSHYLSGTKTSADSLIA